MIRARRIFMERKIYVHNNGGVRQWARKTLALVGGVVVLLITTGVGFAHANTLAPVATNGTITTNKNSAVSGMLSVTDTNTSTLPITFTVLTGTSNGSLSGVNTSTGAFTYTPNSNFVGSDSFTFMGNNGTLNSNTATESIAVVNATGTVIAPTAFGGSVTTNENTPASGTLSGKDTNTSTLPLTFSIVNGPTAGTISSLVSSTGNFTYTPFNAFTGSDQFSFKVNNGVLDSATSSESVLVLANATTTTPSSTPPVISGVMATSTDTAATITWNTDQSANSQVAFGTSSNYNASTTPDPTLVTSHSVALTGLIQNTVYHFAVMSTNASGTMASSSDMTFTTLQTMSSSSTTDTQAIENEIQQIEHEIQVLVQEIQMILMNQQTGTGNTSSSTSGGGPWAPNGHPSLDQVGPVREGTSIDFGGRNFGANEPVTVTVDGATVATAHTDDGGNFTTGSLPVPMTTGTKTYTFTGSNSGITLSETVTVTP